MIATGDRIADIRPLGDRAVSAWCVATTMTHIEGERREQAVREIIAAVRAQYEPRQYRGLTAAQWFAAVIGLLSLVALTGWLA